MPGKSRIEWTGDTWNPVTGCTKVSPGCDHCYAETFAERFRGVAGHPYEHGFDLTLRPERLGIPIRWQRPRTIFVNSMSDLFHAQVPYDFVAQVWRTMAATPRHTYQILTKRPDRMQRFVLRLVEEFGVLPNVWLGTSIEDQKRSVRMQYLPQTPAAIRFVSAEPLLSFLDLYGALIDLGSHGHPAIDWLIIGGESGPGARPCELTWIIDLMHQCQDAQVAVFVKQLGSRLARNLGASGKGDDPEEWPRVIRVREMPKLPAPQLEAI